MEQFVAGETIYGPLLKLTIPISQLPDLIVPDLHLVKRIFKTRCQEVSQSMSMCKFKNLVFGRISASTEIIKGKNSFNGIAQESERETIVHEWLCKLIANMPRYKTDILKILWHSVPAVTVAGQIAPVVLAC